MMSGKINLQDEQHEHTLHERAIYLGLCFWHVTLDYPSIQHTTELTDDIQHHIKKDDSEIHLKKKMLWKIVGINFMYCICFVVKTCKACVTAVTWR